MKQKFLTSLYTVDFELLGQKMIIMDLTQMLDISSVIEKHKDDVLVYTANDDEKIEGISYYLYQSTNYYDLLMIMNGITNVEQLPKNQDIVFARADEEYYEWFSIVGKLKTEKERQQKRDELLEIIKLENEKFRQILYFKKQILSLVETDLKNLIKEQIR